MLLRETPGPGAGPWNLGGDRVAGSGNDGPWVSQFLLVAFAHDCKIQGVCGKTNSYKICFE